MPLGFSGSQRTQIFAVLDLVTSFAELRAAAPFRGAWVDNNQRITAFVMHSSVW